MKYLVTGVIAAMVVSGAAWAQIKPEAERFIRLADTASAKGDQNGAIQLMQSAIIQDPAAPTVYTKLAQLYAKADNASAARIYYAMALDIDPTDAPALRGVALLDLAAGQRDQAEAEHELLEKSCGPACPETTEVKKALESAGAGLDRTKSAN